MAGLWTRAKGVLAAGMLVLGGSARGQQQPLPLAAAHGTTGPGARTLHVALELPNAQTNGVAIAPDGRMFLVVAKQKGQDVPQVCDRDAIPG